MAYRTFPFALGVLLLSLAPAVGPGARVASAEEISLLQMEEAREGYAAGFEAYKKGDFVEAEQSFQRCYQILKTPSLLYDLALTREKQRRWRAAADTYEAYLHDAGKKAREAPRINKRVVELRARADREEKLAEKGKAAAPAIAALPPVSAAPDRLLDLSGEATEVHPGMATPDATAEAVAEAQPAAPVETARAAPEPAKPAVEEKKKSKTWVWAVVGASAAVVVGAGVGLGVGLSHKSPPSTDLGDIGVGAALIRF